MTLFPTNKLLFFTGLVFFPGSILPVLYPAALIPVCVFLGLFFLLVCLDGLVSFRILSGLSITAPDIVRLSRGHTGDLVITVLLSQTIRRYLRLGFSFPPELTSESPDRTVFLKDHMVKMAVAWPITGLRQGNYVLERCYLETPSRAGFWAVRGSAEFRSEIRVYPDLFSERKTLASLFLDRGAGVHARRLTGKGREFEKLREYVPGDSYEDIHWKATAKRGIPISKVFQVERTQDIYVMIDASRMSARNAAIFQESKNGAEKRGKSSMQSESILERYITAALTTALASEKQGDRFGVGLFSDTMNGFIAARSGKAHFNTCRDLLYRTRPVRVNPDFSEFFTFLGTRLRKRALLFILTSLDDPVLAESFLSNIHILSRRHLVVVNMLKPATAKPLFSTDTVKSAGDIARHLSGHAQWQNLRELERSLRRQGAGFFLLDNARLCQDIIVQYLDIKGRQVL